MMEYICEILVEGRCNVMEFICEILAEGGAT